MSRTDDCIDFSGFVSVMHVTGVSENVNYLLITGCYID